MLWVLILVMLVFPMTQQLMTVHQGIQQRKANEATIDLIRDLIRDQTKLEALVVIMCELYFHDLGPEVVEELQAHLRGNENETD